ncbi:MAG TPA: M23 family metallopeptidase [Galbitalea sp.]|jgi:hypothetical protein
MTVVIVNPFAGCTVGWSWAEHRAAGYEGGTDYIMYPPRQITAAADGVVRLVAAENGFTPGKAIFLQLADGRSINYREVASTLVKSGAKVKRGQPIGMPNKASRWPHIDATVGGVRVPFEPLVNALSTASGGSTPLDNTPEKKDENMNGLKYLTHMKNGNGVGFALVGAQFPNGALTTTDVAVAKGWSAISDNGGDAIDDDRWAPILAAAKIASDAWKAAVKPAAGVVAGDNSEALAAILASLKTINDTIAGIHIPTQVVYPAQTGTLE